MEGHAPRNRGNQQDLSQRTPNLKQAYHCTFVGIYWGLFVRAKSGQLLHLNTGVYYESGEHRSVTISCELLREEGLN